MARNPAAAAAATATTGFSCTKAVTRATRVSGPLAAALRGLGRGFLGIRAIATMAIRIPITPASVAAAPARPR